MRAENRDLDHPGRSPVRNLPPEMSHMQEFWAEAPTRDQPVARAAGARVAGGGRASAPALGRFRPDLGTAEHLCTSPAGPRVSPDPGHGRPGRQAG